MLYVCRKNNPNCRFWCKIPLIPETFQFWNAANSKESNPRLKNTTNEERHTFHDLTPLGKACSDGQLRYIKVFIRIARLEMSPTCMHEWPLKFRLGTISPTVCVIRQTSAACIKTADILSQNNYILDCIVYWMGSNCWTRSIKTAGKNILNRGAQYRLNIGRTNLYKKKKKQKHIYTLWGGWPGESQTRMKTYCQHFMGIWATNHSFETGIACKWQNLVQCRLNIRKNCAI